MIADGPASLMTAAADEGCSASGHRRRTRDPRRRLLAAAERIASEHGVDAITVEGVCAAAHLPQAAFASVFADREDCLLAVFDYVSEKAGELMTRAYHEQSWRVDGVRAALLALLEFLERRPHIARFMVLDSLAGGRPMLARRARVLAGAARALDRALPHAQLTGAAPFGAEAVVGSVAAILHVRLIEESSPRLRELSGSLMAVIVLPYLGVPGAQRELSRELSPNSRHDGADEVGEPAEP